MWLPWVLVIIHAQRLKMLCFKRRFRLCAWNDSDTKKPELHRAFLYLIWVRVIPVRWLPSPRHAS